MLPRFRGEQFEARADGCHFSASTTGFLGDQHLNVQSFRIMLVSGRALIIGILALDPKSCVPTMPDCRNSPAPQRDRC